MQRDATTTEVRSTENKPGNLVELVYRNAGLRGAKDALGAKVDGEWRTISYAELYERIRNLAAGLSALGVGRGSKVGLMSKNRPEWPISDLAIQSLGAINVPIYPTLEARQVSHILENSEASTVIVENEDMLRRVLAFRDGAPGLKNILTLEADVANGEDVRSFESVEEAGSRNQIFYWEQGWWSLERDDVATIMYTSGTTGLPKGAILTHGNILSNVEGILDALPLRSDDVFLSLLPLSHVFERTGGQYTALALGATIYYAESIEKVPENLREIRPTSVPSVPRLYEKMYDRVMSQVAEGSGLSRRIFQAAIADGKRKYEIEKSGETVGRALALRLKIYDRLVFRKLRDVVGGRLRFFVSGGAKLNAEIGEFFYAAGINISEGYGLTETSPVISCNRIEGLRFGTVGKPLSNLEVRTSDAGEIEVKGPSVMRGYLKNDEANAEAFTEDGFFKTGDVGEFDDEGCLKITDRAKNLIVLSTGKNVAPQQIETSLVARPHISQSVLLGDGRKYVATLIVPDYEAVRKALSTDADNDKLSKNERVRDLVQGDIEAATKDFASYERPKKFALLSQELSEEKGELTPTLKVKMPVIREHYNDTIEGLYF